MSVKMRQIVEKEIATAVIDNLLRAGFEIYVDNGDNDGRGYELAHSIDQDAILKAMFQTDEDRLFVGEQHGRIVGWVYFVYGNDGWDVINDYTVNLEPCIGAGTAVEKVVDKYSD